MKCNTSLIVKQTKLIKSPTKQLTKILIIFLIKDVPCKLSSITDLIEKAIYGSPLGYER